MMTTPIFHAMYFPIYEKCKFFYSSMFEKGHNDFQVVVCSSSTAAVICNTITNPLWLV